MFDDVLQLMKIFDVWVTVEVGFHGLKKMLDVVLLASTGEGSGA
jgi:hypothetical protein